MKIRTKRRKAKRRLTANARRPNPLKLDPTRTITLRRSFAGEVKKRFALLKGRVVRLILDEDALGLREVSHDPFTANAFCPTGEGGGVDPSCSPSGSKAGSPLNSTKKWDDWVEKNYTDWASGLAPENRKAMEDYYGPKYQLIQAYLRGDKDLPDKYKWYEKDEAFVQSLVEKADLALASAPPLDRPIHLGRGMSAYAHPDATALYQKLESGQIKEGSVITDSGYQSTSRAGKEWPGDIKLFFTAPAGLKASPRGAFQEGDNELTLPRGASFRVTGIRVDTSGNRKRYSIDAEYTYTPSVPNGVTANTRWKFQTHPQQVQAFQTWLKAQVSQTLVSQTEELLWQRYTEAGFKKGAGRAFDDVRTSRLARERPELFTSEHQASVADFYQGTRDEFLRSAFARPEAVDKVKLLAGRSFDDLENVTADMSTRMSRVLTDGLVQGQNPRDIARTLAGEVDLGRDRALLIARTEVIRAHAEGQLEALERLGVEEVGVAVEWATAGDEKVCPLCESLEGVVLKLEEARGMLPRHPNCRCCWLPANVGEGDEGQKDTKGRIDAALEEAGVDDVNIARGRPQSILGNALDDFSRFLADNAFCPTGDGGGVDPSCSPKDHGGGKKTLQDLGQALTTGDPRECYENARKEYLAQKEAGNNPTYHVGVLDSYPKPDKWHSEEDILSKQPAPIPHAWVEVDGKVIDPTPFKYGIGNFSSLPSRPAQDNFLKATYVTSRTVPESKLGTVLKYFPATENAFCPTGPGGGVNPHCSPGGGTPAAVHAASGLAVGHTFTKLHQGRAYRVTVTPAGFEVTDQNGSATTYKSLSAAAQGVRGNTTAVNGWAFFNVAKPVAGVGVAAPAPTPPAATPAPTGAVHPGTGLAVGATYTKSFGGQQHTVTVTPTGFQVQHGAGGPTTTYSSLSAAAQGVRGNSTAVNGWAFFKIDKPSAAATPATPAPATPQASSSQPAVPFQTERKWETGKPEPGVLNGIPFAPAPPKFWEKTKDVDVKEPPPIKKIDRVGVMIEEADGRVWVVQPTGQFGNRTHTLPGGGVEKGLSNQQNALKEVWEETGLQVQITGHLGDFKDSNNGNNGRLYIGKRIGGSPWDAKIEQHIRDPKTGQPAAESESVTLVTKDRAAQLLHRTDDLAQLATVRPIDVKTSTAGNMMQKLVEGVQPAAKQYEKDVRKGGGHPGNAELHAVQELRGFNGAPQVVSRKDMDALVAGGTHIEMLRGLKATGSLTAKDLTAQFKTGDHFPGAGCFGSGTYADSSKGSGNAARSYGMGGDTIRMALPRTAKIINQSELERAVSHAPAGSTGDNGSHSRTEGWWGTHAALAGYDAIHVDGKSRSHGSYGRGYYVILNRSVLTVQKESAKGHVIS